MQMGGRDDPGERVGDEEAGAILLAQVGRVTAALLRVEVLEQAGVARARIGPPDLAAAVLQRRNRQVAGGRHRLAGRDWLGRRVARRFAGLCRRAVRLEQPVEVAAERLDAGWVEHREVVPGDPDDLEPFAADRVPAAGVVLSSKRGSRIPSSWISRALKYVTGPRWAAGR